MKKERRILAVGCALAIVGGLGLGTSGCGGGECGGGSAPQATEAQGVLLEPGAGAFLAEPPDTFEVVFETTQGEMVVQVVKEWAPIGATRFYNLVRNGFYDGNAFFRVLPGFIVQFGAHPVPAVQAAWDAVPLRDDPVLQSNTRGMVTFATAGENTRTTQLFINYGDNAGLDGQGFAPFGRVVRGMGVADRLYSGYGEVPPGGEGPSWACMVQLGGTYLDRRYPRLDRITKATLVERDTMSAGVVR